MALYHDLLPAEPLKSDFINTFEVLVGVEPKQQRFTVHHDIITKRSGFFRVARSERWTSNKSKVADLQHCDPELFAHYLHCVYRDAVPFFSPGGRGTDKERIMCELSYENGVADGCYEHLVRLYIMADSLQDPITANLVIDEVRRLSRQSCTPQTNTLELAFDHTLPGDGMRNVLADIFIFGGDVFPDDIDYPAEFLMLLIERHKTMRHMNPEVEAATRKAAEETLWAFKSTPKWDGNGMWTGRDCHQKVEEDQEEDQEDDQEEDPE